MKELSWMMLGKSKDDWVHTTQILVTFANANRDPKNPPIRFEDVYPYGKAQAKKTVSKDEMGLLKDMWLGLCSKKNRG